MKFEELKEGDYFKLKSWWKTDDNRIYVKGAYFHPNANAKGTNGCCCFMNDQEVEPIGDNPEFDNTPYEHPAFTRGVDHCMEIMCKKVNDILNRKDTDTKGITNCESWNKLRKRLITIAADHDLEEYEYD